MSFEILDKKFGKEINLTEFTEKNTEAIKFLLVRCLDTHHLRHICQGEEITAPSGKLLDLQKIVFASKITSTKLVKYIRELYPEERTRRLEAEDGLEKIIQEFGSVKCGLRNDKVDDLVKTLVRDKTIKSRADLTKAIEDRIVTKIRDYSLWSFYNQVTNDLIEHAFNDHKKVIPTLRKIPGVDFFLQLGDDIIPFDLKITHISDDFFDLFAQGLKESSGRDNYTVNESGKSETWLLKDVYKRKKREFGLGPVGDLSKEEIIKALLTIQRDAEVSTVLKKINEIRAGTVNHLMKDLHSLEWWNYKFQGERLFKNNNRFFVFLAHRLKFEDARALKGEIKKIRKKIENRLDEVSKSKISTVKYYYDKERQLEGAYETKALSVLFTD